MSFNTVHAHAQGQKSGAQLGPGHEPKFVGGSSADKPDLWVSAKMSAEIL